MLTLKSLKRLVVGIETVWQEKQLGVGTDKVNWESWLTNVIPKHGYYGIERKLRRIGN
jgi:hypothetical protein